MTLSLNQQISAQFRAANHDSVGRLLLMMYRSFSSLAAKKLIERGYTGLGLSHVTVVANIDAQGTRIITLAERVNTTKQYMGRIVQELASEGYVNTVTDPTDRRATLVTNTPKGWQFLADAHQINGEIEALYLAQLGDNRMADLVSALQTLLQNASICDPDQPAVGIE